MPRVGAALALLGDSTLDNLRHTGPPDLPAQLRELLADTCRVDLCARDGARVADVHAQLPRVPRDATHLLLSVGGNDLLAMTRLLKTPTPNLGTALHGLGTLRERFAREHRALLEALVALGRPSAVCTVYAPRFALAARQRLVDALLSLINDAIVENACALGLPVLDLRPLSCDPEHFVSEIELGHRGALRFAQAIARLLASGGLERGAARLHPALV